MDARPSIVKGLQHSSLLLYVKQFNTVLLSIIIHQEMVVCMSFMMLPTE